MPADPKPEPSPPPAPALDLDAALTATFESAPVGIGLWDRELRYVYVNGALAAMNGLPPAAHVGKTIAELLPEVDLEVMTALREVVTSGAPVSHEVGGETPAAPGARRTWAVHYFPVRAEGAVVAVGAVCEEVTARRQAEERARRHEAERREIAEALPQIVWTSDAAGAPTYYNRKFVEYTGLAGSPGDWSGIIHEQDLAAVIETSRAARVRGAPFELSYRLRRHDGVYRWQLARVVPVRDGGGAVIAWVGAATDVDEHKRFLDEQRYLADASVVLGASLDLGRTLGEVARLVVPHLSDWCAIDLLDARGTIERAAVAHVDPAKVELAWEIWRRLPPKPEDPGGVYAVVRTRSPEVHAVIPDELLVQSIPDPELLALFRSLGLCSSMCVPLIASDRVLGTLTLVASESRRHYEPRDLAFAQELARRIAIAVDNARLFAEVEQARAAAEALSADVINQSQQVQAALLAMRAERDRALARIRELEAGRTIE